jgi:hypothetical protein
MTGFVWRSAAVAALFAFHPMRVESVAWISERKDLLVAALWLLTMLVYHWYSKRPNRARYTLVTCAFSLALMAKPMAVTLPLVCCSWTTGPSSDTSRAAADAY